MQMLKLDEELTRQEEEEAAEDATGGFWKRNFQLSPTRAQQKFDWVCGVGLPLVCFAADPLVFVDEHAVLYKYKTFAYVLSIVSIMSMTAWLLWGQRLGGLRPYLGGLFLAGAAISLIVGVILLPYSLLGMVVLIGFLGFAPLLSSFVYLRNAVRTIEGAEADSTGWAVCRAVAIATIYSLIVPFVLNY